MARYVAFIRGINVGGNKQVNMAALKRAFEYCGFTSIETVLASGNVIFDSSEEKNSDMERVLKKKLGETLKIDVDIIVRSREELGRLTEAEPFSGIIVTPQTRLYVTFLAEAPNAAFRKPYESKGFRIIKVSEREVCTVLTLSAEKGTVDLMDFLESRYGRRITTRNWNTIVKVLNKAGTSC